jgi:hypothetical protein
MSHSNSEAQGRDRDRCVRGVVKGIEDTLVGPGESSRVETIIGSGVGRSLGNEGEGSVKLGVVCYRSDREEGGGSQSRTGSSERLRTD